MSKQNRLPWYEFKAQAEADDTVAELRIFGPIGGGFSMDEDAVTGKVIAKQLDELPDSVKTIRVRVNSPGGSPFDAIQIANALRRQHEEHGRSIEVEIEALAASAATVVTSAGTSIRMPRNALMMLHNPYATGMGDAKLLRELADVADKVKGLMVATYLWVSKLSAKKLSALMDETTWMDADEAKANGFVTQVAEPVKIAAALNTAALEALGDIPEAYRDRLVAMLEPGLERGTNKRDPKESRSKPSVAEGAVAQAHATDASASTQPSEETMATKGTKTAATSATVDVADVKAAAKEKEKERERVLGIQNAASIAKVAGLDAQTADPIASSAIEEDDSMDTAREKLFEALAAQSDRTGPGPNAQRPGSVVAGEDERDKRVRGISAALWDRANVTQVIREAVKKEPDHPAFAGVAFDPGDFRGMSLLDHAREDLERHQSGSTRGRTKMRIAGDFFAAAGSQTTGDFSVALEEALHKLLQASYMVMPDDWRRFCRVGTVSDFRAHNRYRRGFLGRLDKVLESGEFVNKTAPDTEKEVQQAETYGNILALSRQALVNDDMGVFSDLAATLGRAAALSIEIEVFNTLKLNSGLGPNMNDGKTLFHADHNNLGDGAAIAVSALEKDRVLMAQQTDPSGNEFLDLRPAVLVLPVGLGGTARVINKAQFDTEVNSKFQVPNKVVGLFRDIVDTARLSGTRRYLFADPMTAPVIEVAFLEGEQEPLMEVKDGWRVDGVEWKVRHDFGVAAIDFRGAVTDVGA